MPAAPVILSLVMVAPSPRDYDGPRALPQSTQGSDARPGPGGDPAVDTAADSISDQAPVEEIGDLDIGGVDLGGDGFDIADMDLDTLLGSVSSVSRRTESLAKAPASVSVLDRTQIRRSGVRTLADLLRQVPGVQVVKSAPGNYLVSMRGMGGLQGNNVVVLIDGVPVNRVVDGTIDWGGLPVHIDDVERIEVVRGPVSPVYGSNAYAGVINIITTERISNGLWGAARPSFGIDHEGNTAQRLLATVGGRHERVDWHLSLDAGQDALFRDNGDLPDGGRHPVATKYGAVAKLDIHLAEHHELQIRGSASVAEHSGLDQLVLESHPQRNDFATGTVGYEASNLPSVVDTAGVWVRGRWQRTTTDPDLYEGFSYDGLGAFETLGGADLLFDFPHDAWLGVGVNGGVQRVDAPFMHPDENAKLRPRYGAYADGGIDAAKAVVVSASLRLDDSAMMARPQLSYRAAAVYYREIFALRLAGGSAFREPTFVEVGGRFEDPESGQILLEGTAGLESPRVDSVELGAVIAPSTLTIKPTLYFASAQNLMVTDFEPLVRKSFQNDGERRPLLGGELEATWQFVPSMGWKLTGAALWWLKEIEDLSATVAVPVQNSAYTLWSGFHGSWIADRLAASLGVGYTSPRRYTVRAGIPPQIIDVTIGHLARPEATVEYQFLRDTPFWCWARAYSTLPHARVESPFPGAGKLGTAVFLGVGYRG